MVQADYNIHLHGGDRGKAAARFSIPEEQLIDFSSNINPLGLHPKVETIINDNIHRVMFYPDPECRELRKKLSGYYNIAIENILAGNGSAELIDLLARTLKPGQALIPEPNFSEYARALFLNGTTIHRLNGSAEKGFKVGVEHLNDEMLNHLPEGSTIFISNPNNPAGYLYTKTELDSLLETCRERNHFLVIDEAFIQFTKGAEQNSMANRVNDSPHLAVLQAYTKIFSIPGLRLGMIITHRELIEKMAASQIRWSVNGLAQVVGSILLNEKEYLDDTVNYTATQREHMIERLKKIPGLECFSSTANYILCRMLVGISLIDLEEYLGKHGFIVRNCSNYHGLGPNFFRIAVRQENENKRLLDLIQSFFSHPPQEKDKEKKSEKGSEKLSEKGTGE